MLSKNLLALTLIPLFIGCQQVTANPEADGILARLDATGDLLIASRVKVVPLDPADPAWGNAKETVVPLASQSSVAPRAPVFKKSELSVRTLFSGKEVGFLLSWDDPTQDDLESGIGRFRDAVAIGVPVNFQKQPSLPYIGMGSKGHPMNIWQWKASWQADLERGYQGIAETHEKMVPDVTPIPHRTADEAGSPMAQLKRTSPVENLLAEGFGTLTSVPDKRLNGKGVWKEGRWTVVIKRARDFKGLVPVTFSVWDGAGAERNGMKGLSRWRFLRLEGEEAPYPFLKGLIVGPISDADPQRGRQLVSEMGCTSCHNFSASRDQAQGAVEGEAPSGFARGGGDASPYNDVGPDLAHAGSIHRPEYLLESIKDPNAIIVPGPGYYHRENQPRSGVEGEAPSGSARGGGDASPYQDTSTMPSFGDQLPEKDAHDIVEYLRNL